MNDTVMRRVLRTTAGLNLGAALLFAFPASLGQLAGLPAPAPALYTTFLALLVALFGVTYAWLARQSHIDRPLVAFCALGKLGFVVVAVGCWLLGDLPGRAALFAGGDLVFAVLFAWWLMTDTAVRGTSTASRAA
jgi:hypothetical protein